MQTVDIINSAGVLLILTAFFLLTMRLLSPRSLLYSLLNLTGAGLACYGSWVIKAYPFVVLEGVWALVALAGLIKNNFGAEKNK
jgi:hypothetical protein